jgi:hypothetical protein
MGFELTKKNKSRPPPDRQQEAVSEPENPFKARSRPKSTAYTYTERLINGDLPDKAHHYKATTAI